MLNASCAGSLTGIVRRFDLMSIYWSLKSVPELAPLTHKQRHRVHAQCLRRHFFRANATTRSVLAFVAALSIAVIFCFLGSIAPTFAVIPRSVWFIGSVWVGFEAGHFVLSRIAIPVLRPFYHEFISGVSCEHAV